MSFLFIIVIVNHAKLKTALKARIETQNISPKDLSEKRQNSAMGQKPTFSLYTIYKN